jgi:hypothetical protein
MKLIGQLEPNFTGMIEKRERLTTKLRTTEEK